MGKRYDIEKLKQEHVGKTCNWLTVLDVYTNSNNRTVCLCRCKCGTEKEILIKYIRSNSIKSCGCYKHSEEYSESCSNWCNNNPDIVKQRSEKYKQWALENKDFILEKSKRHREFYKNNKDAVDALKQHAINLNKTYNKELATNKRISAINEICSKYNLAEIIHGEDYAKLISGDMRACDKIRSKCPICGAYSEHNLRDIINISEKCIKQARLCKNCFSTSHYEEEIANSISTFYNGTLIRNSRDIISPLELDLYYPEKKIAIEFNGDYWHDENHKDPIYHYSKFKLCLESNILLVSIFYSYWNKHSDLIKDYLRDLFNFKKNSLSFLDSYINNNYPFPGIQPSDISYIELSYDFHNAKVFTCGLSKSSDIKQAIEYESS